MKYLFLLLTCISLCASAQKDTVFIRYNSDKESDKIAYTTDTVLFETSMARHILKGTTILPYTHTQQVAKGYGIYLEKVAQSDCQKDATVKWEPTRINSVIDKEGEMIIDINLSDNCCYSFLCDIEIVRDSIINLIYHGYGTYCDCDCCFGLTYTLTKEKVPELSKINSVMVNGDLKTLRKLRSGK